MQRRVLHILAVCFVLVMGAIVLHTPVTMFLGMLLPSVAVIIKGWKEAILVLIAMGCLLVLIRDRSLRSMLAKDTLVRLSSAFIGIHLALSMYYFHGWHAFTAGLANDLRYVLIMVVALILSAKVTWLKKVTTRVVAIGALLVGVFGVMQLTVLPHDILQYIGYDWQPGKVAPYLTVDGDSSFIRIGSTLRGPNPLGFYAATILAISAAWLVKRYKKGLDRANGIAVALAALMSICVWFSYSRGALLAALAGLAVIVGAILWNRHRKLLWTILSSLVIVLLLVVTVFRHNQFVATVVFHDSPSSGAVVTSNEGHLSSLQNGLAAMVRQPLGGGIGSSGSASYYSDDTSTLYIENQYLLIAHESGWIGLILFVLIFSVLLRRLWKLRDDYLAYGLLASGIGLAIACFVLPVWSDDTIAYIWWGLAGVMVARYQRVGSSSSSLLRQFVEFNRKLSGMFDAHCIPNSWRVDGLKDYHDSIAPPLVRNARVIHDVGGGKLPYLGTVMDKQSNQSLIGFDIDESELAAAPQGVYDSWIVGDIGSAYLARPKRKADLVISQVVLEHVKDNVQAIKNITENTKSGGTIALFVPSRNAAFARLNLMLPQRLKETLLFGIFPEARHAQGFPAYYHLCTVRQMSTLLADNNCEIVDQKQYYQGHYFSFFVPLHILWRMYQAIGFLVVRENAADYYCLIAKKR